MTTTAPISLIALSGYAGSGKDAAAAQLASVGWERRAFADPLRSMAYALDPLVPHPDGGGEHTRLSELVDAHGWDHVKRRWPEVRRLLQRLGTDAGRQVLGVNVWVDRTLDQLPPFCVVTDCRFWNEAEAVQDLGGLVIRIERPGVGPVVGIDGVHTSESALAGFPYDAVVQNRGSLDDLGRLVLDAIAWHELARARHKGL